MATIATRSAAPTATRSAPRPAATDTPAELTLAYVGELVDEQLSIDAIHRAVHAASTADAARRARPIVRPRRRPGRSRRRVRRRWLERGALCLVGPDGTGAWLTPRPGGFDGVRALDGAWLEHALDGVGRSSVDLPARRRRTSSTRSASGDADAGRADPSDRHRRDPAHGRRAAADAAEVDVLHAEAAHRPGDPRPST